MPICLRIALLQLTAMQTALLQNLLLNTRSELSLLTQNTLRALIYAVVPASDGLLIRVSASKLRKVCLLLRSSTLTQLRSLVDIAAVDKLHAAGRFTVNYLFLSMTTNQRVIVQLFTNETNTIPSLAVPFGRGQRLFAGAS